MPVPNPRQSIYALRGWIDRIEQDARADAAKKYATLDAKPATPPSDNPWGPGEVSIRLTPEHGCASGPPTRGSVVTPSPTEAPRPSAPEAARAPLRSERAPQRGHGVMLGARTTRARLGPLCHPLPSRY